MYMCTYQTWLGVRSLRLLGWLTVAIYQLRLGSAGKFRGLRTTHGHRDTYDCVDEEPFI